MAATVWEGLVRGDLSYEEIIQWLESRDDAEILNSKIFTSRRDEFVELFQRNLRDEAARIFTATAEYCTSPKKAIRVAHSFKNRCRNAHSKEKDHFPPIRPMRAHNSNTLPDSYIKSQKQNVPQVRADTSANGSGSKPYRNDSRPQQRKWRQFNPRNANTSHAQDSNCAASDYNGANSYRSSGYEKRAGPNRQKQSNNAGGFKRPQCGNVSLGDFVKGDNRQRKEKSMHPKESSPRRINPTFLGSCGAYPKNKSQRRFHSENWDNDNNFPRPVKGGCDASIPYRSGKYAPIEIPPSTEDWEAEMAAAAASSGPGKYAPIEIPPSTEDWEAEMAAAAAAASSGPGKYAPIEIPPSTEDWEAEMAAAAAAASSGPGKYAPIEIPPSTEDWEAEMAAAAAAASSGPGKYAPIEIPPSTEDWEAEMAAAAAAASSGPGKYVPIEIPPSTEDWEAEMAAAAAAVSSGPGKYAPIEIPPSTEDWEAEMAAAAAAASSGPGKYVPIEIPPSTEDWEAEMAAAAAAASSGPGKYVPIEIPPSTEDWEAEMAAAAAAASSGPGKYVPIEIPPSTEDWEAEMAAAAAAASSGPGKYVPIEIPPSTEDWEAEMAAAAAAASSGPGKYAPIEIPPSTEDWEAEMAAAAASRNVASDVAKVLTATEEWDSDSFADSPGEMGSEDDFSFERLLLKVERLKSQHWSAKLSANAGLPAADFKLPPAFLEKVTDKDRLDTLIAVYCYILRSNLTLNPSSEMCFLANLLVVSCPPGPEPEPQSLLDSVHNCVYFAGTVLEKSSHLLAMFDRTALKLLLRNDRLSKCVPDFNDELKKLFGDVKTLGEYPNRDGSFANVNFKPETDSKFNFPSDFFFISFKKQRDGFYEALETWEAGHSLPRWSFAQSLGAKVKAIVGGGNEEPVNFVHFCRLFRDQLLGNCSGTLESGEDDLDEDTRCFLKSLKSQDPSKYARLSERLSRPRHSHPTQRSDFPGHQEFYKEFILSANNAKLNAHMIDAFISEISTICAVSEVNLRLEDYDDCGARVVDEKTSQVYATTVASLRVLAKFLGFLVFIPYRSTVRINCDIASKHAEARANTHPPVDVRLALQKAINSNNLVLAVPWVTKFLSMADPVSMAMPYFVSVTRMLFQLYKTVGIDEKKTCPSTKLLVQLSLGWLFESSCFPGGQYFGWYFDDDCPETYVSLPIEGEIGKMDTGLDCIPFASRPNVLQAACPGLRRITVMLATRGGNASRFVTPSAVPWRKESKEATWRKVEETFFQGQVPDVERTVFYVAEKIGSSTISFVRTKYLPDLRAEALEEIEPEIMKLGPYQRNKFSRNWSVTSLKKCSEKLQSMCTEQTAAALKALLPMHMGPGTIDFSAAVAARIALKKAVAWLNDLAYSDYFKLGLSDDLEKLHRKSWKVHHAKLRYEPKTSHAIDAKLRSVDHDNNAASPAQSIIELRALMLSIIDGTMLNVNQIEMAFNNVKDTCQRREDLAPAAERIMQTLIMDVLFGLVLKQPDVLMAVMPLARTLWALPELKLTPIDATNFVSPVQLTALSKIDIQPSNVEGFFTLLDSVVNGSAEAKYLLQRRMGNMEATPKGYYGVSSVIIKAIWHIATSQTKTYDI